MVRIDSLATAIAFVPAAAHRRGATVYYVSYRATVGRRHFGAEFIEVLFAVYPEDVGYFVHRWSQGGRNPVDHGVHFLPRSVGHMHVDHRASEASVPEQRFYYPNIQPLIEHLRCI